MKWGVKLCIIAHAVIFNAAGVASNPAQWLEHTPTIKNKLKEFSGEFVVVQFWSPYCDACGNEVNEMNRIETKTRSTSSGVKIVGVPVQGRQTEYSAFMEHFKPKYEQLWISKEEASRFSEQYRAVPVTFLFDKNQKLLKYWIGQVNGSELENNINQPKEKI